MGQRLIPLSQEGVRRGLAEHENIRLHVFDELDSTNNEAKRLAVAGDKNPVSDGVALIAARSQTAGRGRLGRSFFSPPDTGLYMTLLFRTCRTLDHVVPVTAAAAVAASRVVAECVGVEVGIKWVNDLYRCDRKVCGILTEAVTPRPGETYIAVGWGVNLTTEGFPDGLRAPAGCLLDAGKAQAAPPGALDVGYFCGRIARELLSLLEGDALTAPDTLAAYRRRLILTGHRVRVTRGEEILEGTVRGVDDAYGLILETAGGVHVLHSGEVSVRLC